MGKFFKIMESVVCMLMIGSFAMAGNGRGHAHRKGQGTSQAVKNQNCEMQQNRYQHRNHRSRTNRGAFGAEGQMQNQQRRSGPKGNRSGVGNGSSPINKSEIFQPNHTDTNHDGIGDNTPDAEADSPPFR